MTMDFKNKFKIDFIYDIDITQDVYTSVGYIKITFHKVSILRVAANRLQITF